MQRRQGAYALIQFSPVPERMEFLNLGVVLVVPDLQFLEVRFSVSHARMERYFRQINESYLKAAQEALRNRLKLDFEKQFSLSDLQDFAERRANELRVGSFLPVAVSDPAVSLDRLFDQLVGEDQPRVRRPRMERVLRRAFIDHKVHSLLHEKPAPVDLPGLGILRVPFGYQNGAYHLIDGMQISHDRNDAMKEAGKRALEGRALAKVRHPQGSQMRLSVIADFSAQPDAFYDAISEQFEDDQVRLYRLEDLKPLVDDIQHNAAMLGVGRH